MTKKTKQRSAKVKHRRPGRPKNRALLPYHAAVDYLRRHAPPMRNHFHYLRWHEENEIRFLPKRPNRVYAEWEGWNAFLGTSNSFEKKLAELKGEKINYRPFWEAVRFSQAAAKEHGITTQKEWEEWWDSGQCPRDIPKRPQLIYDEFTGKGWKVWLGKRTTDKVAAQRENVTVFALCRVIGAPANVIATVRDTGGVMSLREKCNGGVIGRPYRVYRWEDDLAQYIERALRTFASEVEPNRWIVPNVNQLFFELDTLLEFAVPPRELGTF